MDVTVKNSIGVSNNKYFFNLIYVINSLIIWHD
jgi:hypothetical protein